MQPSPVVLMRRSLPALAGRRSATASGSAGRPLDLANLAAFDFPLTRPALLNVEEQRVYLHYLRLEELGFDQLVAFRQKFRPPSSAQVVKVRHQHYQGEQHPASARVSVTFSPSHPSLNLSDQERHKLLLLAGSRWNGRDGPEAEIKMSCEMFGSDKMNEKWLSDTLDAMLKEAKNGTDHFEDVPLSSVVSQHKAKKSKRSVVSLKDFPREWLPQTPTSSG